MIFTNMMASTICSEDLQAVNRCMNDIHRRHAYRPWLDGLATVEGRIFQEVLQCSFVEETFAAVAPELGIHPCIRRPGGEAWVLS